MSKKSELYCVSDLENPESSDVEDLAEYAGKKPIYLQVYDVYVFASFTPITKKMIAEWVKATGE